MYATVQSAVPCEFVARIVTNPLIPPAVGVPAICLDVASKLKPAGSTPTTVYVGTGEPVACGTVRVVIAVPAVQDCADPVGSANTGGLSTDHSAVHVALPRRLVAVTVTVPVPLAVGAPVISLVVALKLRPAGSPAAE